MNKKYRKILAGISAIVMCSILAAGCVNNIEREPENNSKVDDEIIAEINGEDVKPRAFELYISCLQYYGRI